jgi:hypothetical protein
MQRMEISGLIDGECDRRFEYADYADCIVMMPFLKCLAGGLRHFLELQNGGPPGSRSEGSGEQGGGEMTRP